MDTRQRNVTFVVVVLGVAVLVVAGILIERPIREQWYLSQLESDIIEEQILAAKVCFRRACKISSKWAAAGGYLGHGVAVDGAFR